MMCEFQAGFGFFELCDIIAKHRTIHADSSTFNNTA